MSKESRPLLYLVFTHHSHGTLSFFFSFFFFFEIHEEITLGEKNKTPNKALAAEIKLGMNICGDNGFEYACLKICNTDVKNLDHQLRWFGVSTKS
jgi:hypothetical protein